MHANVEHQEKMLLRVRKFVASSTNGTKDGDAGDRKAVKMLMENGDGESLITFSTIHPASGLAHLSKGGWYSCIICNRTNSSSKFIRDDYSPWTALDVVRVSTRAMIRYL